MRTRPYELTLYGLNSRSGTKIDMLLLKTETNTGPIGQFFCYIQVILCVSYIMSCMPSRCLYGHACFCVFSTSLFVVWCLCPERFLLCYILARVSFVVS